MDRTLPHRRFGVDVDDRVEGRSAKWARHDGNFLYFIPSCLDRHDDGHDVSLSGTDGADVDSFGIFSITYARSHREYYLVSRWLSLHMDNLWRGCLSCIDRNRKAG